MNKLPKSLNVVLVEPSGSLNLGSVARLCQNFGINEMRLVAPRCKPEDPEAIKMAVRGKKVLKEAKQFSCLLDAIADCRRVVATCGRIEHGEIPLHGLAEALPWLIDTDKSTPIEFELTNRPVNDPGPQA